MKYIKIIAILTIATTTLFSCKKGDHKADSYGNFEATEITVSAESNGKLLVFSI